MKAMTIVYFLASTPESEEGVYLGLKKIKIGAGTLISVGGKVECYETRIAATVREAFEEWRVRVAPQDLKQVALLHISREGVGHEIDLSVYVTKKWEGEFEATKEIGLPYLYLYSEMPYKQMMPADRSWLPAVLFGQMVEVWFTYNQDRTEVIGDVKIKRVESFE